MNQPLFTVLPDGADTFYHPPVLLGIAVAVMCSTALYRQSGSHWSARQAWLRAVRYFGLACALGDACGVWPVLFSVDALRALDTDSSTWQWLTAVWAVQVVVAYGVIWPVGTFTERRPRRPLLGSLYGFCWGLCHSQVFLSIWATVELLPLSRLWVAVLSFVLISAFNGSWHALYWDVKVSPPHNIEEWNVRKVLFRHIPNLVLGMTHLALFENVAVFVAVQTLALIMSAYAMRFPRWDYVEPR